MNWEGLFVGKHPEVYEPSDDTFLLARVVSEHVRGGEDFIEVGCGAGLVAMAAAQQGAQVVATDRNPFAVRLAAANAKANDLLVDVVQTDLLAGISKTPRWVAFNPPYLPTAPDEHVDGPLDWAFDGGPDGNSVALRFARQVCALGPRSVLVIHSSLSDPQPLMDVMETGGYEHSIAASQALPYEQLTVRRFQRR